MKFRKRDFLASNACHKNARYVLAAASWRKPIRLRGERLVREGPSSDGAPASRSRIAKRFHVALGHHGPSHLPAEQISALPHLILLFRVVEQGYDRRPDS